MIFKERDRERERDRDTERGVGVGGDKRWEGEKGVCRQRRGLAFWLRFGHRSSVYNTEEVCAKNEFGN